MKALLYLVCFYSSILLSFAQNPGDNFFVEGVVHEIRLDFSQMAYFDSLKANYFLDAYMSCDITVDGIALPHSGIKYKGNSSYNNQSKKKPFRIDFEEYIPDQLLDGMDKLVLNNAFKDPTFLREKLMLDFIKEQGMAAPRAGFARVYINDHYWGLYSVVEDVNKKFLKTHFDNKKGNLYKGDPRGTLQWKGPDQAMYTGDYELKTNEDVNDWSDLVRLIDVLNNTPAAQLADSLETRLNLDSWFGYWAVHNMFANLDSYVGSGHNYFLYHNKDTDKFEWITWDVNEAFGNFSMGLSLDALKNLPIGHIPQPANQRPIMNRLWQLPSMQQQYRDKYCSMLPDFSSEKLNPRIDELANLIRQYVYADTLKFFNNNLFEQNLNQDINQPQPGASGLAGLKPFIAARSTSLQQQLQCAVTATENPDKEPSKFSLFPNPAMNQFSVVLDAPDKWEVLEIIDASGSVLLTQKTDNQNYINIYLYNFKSGTYFVRLKGPDQTAVQKLILIR